MENNVMTIKNLPDLHQLDASPRELSSDYWTPETEGEYKVGVILEIKTEPYRNEAGEQVDLPCVVILSQEEDRSFSTIRNGSKRLVATIQTALDQGLIQLNETPVRISYIGKQKNKTNAYKSDKWSVKPLIIQS